MVTEDKRLLTRTAKMCRQAYENYRGEYHDRQGSPYGRYRVSKAWDAPKKRPGGQTEDEWMAMARFMLRHGLDPVACIAAAFRAPQSHASPPYPNMLRSSRWLEFFRELQQGAREDVRLQLAWDRETANEQFALQRYVMQEDAAAALLLVLSDEDLEISPLFRYCLAVSEGCRPATERWYFPAVMQYRVAADAYDKEWSRELPADFGNQARRLVNRALTT